MVRCLCDRSIKRFEGSASYSYFLARYCPSFPHYLHLPRALCEVALRGQKFEGSVAALPNDNLNPNFDPQTLQSVDIRSVCHESNDNLKPTLNPRT